MASFSNVGSASYSGVVDTLTAPTICGRTDIFDTALRVNALRVSLAPQDATAPAIRPKADRADSQPVEADNHANKAPSRCVPSLVIVSGLQLLGDVSLTHLCPAQAIRFDHPRQRTTRLAQYARLPGSVTKVPSDTRIADGRACRSPIMVSRDQADVSAKLRPDHRLVNTTSSGASGSMLI